MSKLLRMFICFVISLCLITGPQIQTFGQPNEEVLAPSSMFKSSTGRKARFSSPKQREARGFIEGIPALAQWAQEHPELIRRCGYLVWKEIYQSGTPETAMATLTDIAALEKYDLIESANDVRFLADGLAKIRPILGPGTIEFLAAKGKQIHEAFGKSKVPWAAAVRLGTQASPHLPSFGTLRDLHRYFGFKLDGDTERWNDVVDTMVRLSQNHPLSDDFVKIFLHTIRHTAGKEWTHDWPKTKHILQALEEDTLGQIITLLNNFLILENVDEMRTIINDLKQLNLAHGMDKAPNLFYLKVLLNGWEISSDETNYDDPTLVQWHTYLATIYPDPQHQTDLLKFTRSMAIHNFEDFQLGLAAAHHLLSHTKLSPSEITDKAGILCHNTAPLSPSDFLILYSLMLKFDIPITDETIAQWTDVRDKIPLDPSIQTHGITPSEELLQEWLAHPSNVPPPALDDTAMETRPQILLNYYFNAVWAFLNLNQGGVPDEVLVPARLSVETLAQAQSFAEFLEKDTKSTFVRIGALVGPHGQILAPETNFAKQYKRIYRNTDNLFLVPVRNPLKYRKETIHNRSFTAQDLTMETIARKLIGKGVGTPQNEKIKDVVATYRRGPGVHHFYGGFDKVEKAYVETVEEKLQNAFDTLMSNPQWKTLAEIFDIRKEHLVLQSVASFQPLALPAYLVGAKTKEKFKKDTVTLPDHNPAHGLSLIKSQRLLDHVGIGTVPFGGRNRKTSKTQILQYYLAPNEIRVSEIDNFSIAVPCDNPLYQNILKCLDIETNSVQLEDRKEFNYYGPDGNLISQSDIQRYLFLGLLVRTAMMAHILHKQLRSAGSNDWGSIFGPQNINPITIFDYDTIPLFGNPFTDEDEIPKNQKKDMRYLTGDRSILRNFYRKVFTPAGQETLDAADPGSPLLLDDVNMVRLWKTLYQGDLAALGDLSSAAALPIPDALRAFMRAASESQDDSPRPQPDTSQSESTCAEAA